MARGLLALPLLRLGLSTTPSSAQPLRVCAPPIGRRRPRALGVVRAGGPPSTNALILAFFLPLSLFVGTLITAIRVADSLDERFLQEMAINRAIMEENEAAIEDGDDDDNDYEDGEGEDEAAPPPAGKVEVVAAAPRTRNRPRREA